MAHNKYKQRTEKEKETGELGGTVIKRKPDYKTTFLNEKKMPMRKNVEIQAKLITVEKLLKYGKNLLKLLKVAVWGKLV